jgi:hypothetical protein
MASKKKIGAKLQKTKTKTPGGAAKKISVEDVNRLLTRCGENAPSKFSARVSRSERRTQKIVIVRVLAYVGESPYCDIGLIAQFLDGLVDRSAGCACAAFLGCTGDAARVFGRTAGHVEEYYYGVGVQLP